MSFHEKSIWAMLSANILVYGWYFYNMMQIAVAAPVGEKPIGIAVIASHIVITIVALIVISIVSHIVITLHSMNKEGEVDDSEDERDTLIKLRGESKSGPILGLGVVITIAMILMGNGPFLTANMLLAALILSETVAGIFKLLDYRRGV